MMGNRSLRGSGRIGCILWLAVLALIGYGLYKVIPVKVKTSTFYDFMQEEASFASIRPVEQLQKEILAKARELELPVTKDNLTITRTRESISIEAHYQITLEFFNGWQTYVWKFDQVVARPTFLV
jgi:hypothetical protein